MAEQIEDIAKSIERHSEKEVAKLIPNRAYGRSHVNFDGDDKSFWLTNKPNLGGYQKIKDIHGSVVGSDPGNETTLKEDGDPVFKNSPLGELLISFTNGKHNYKTPKGNVQIEILNSSKYTPTIDELASDVTIQLAGNDKVHAYRTLRHLLNEIAGIQTEIDDLKKQEDGTSTEQGRNEIINRIAEKEQAKKSKLDKAQSFIRKHAELRYQPILDPKQEQIKRSEIFTKSVVINGGPGTGKTTTLIQRIKFLLDLSAKKLSLSDEERKHYINHLSEEKRGKLNGDISWIFFSPNELLKLFLQNAMVEEGLDASTDRLKVWSDHKQNLVRSYKLVNADTQRPFLFYRKKENESFLLPIEGDGLKRVIQALMNFYVNYQKHKLTKITELNLSSFEWKNLGISIQKYIKKSKADSIDSLIRLYYNLNEIYGKEVLTVSNQYNTLINSTTAKWIQIIVKDKERLEKLHELIKDKKASEIDDEEEIDSEDFDESGTNADDIEVLLFRKIKSLIRKIALGKFDKDTRTNSQDRDFLEVIQELKDQEEYDKIGQLAYFKKFIERGCKGLHHNLFREIPLIYKRYRKANSSNKKIYQSFAQELVSKDGNRRLHDDEQALLLFIINRLVGRLERLFPATYAATDDPYVNAQKQAKKNIIGIDEVTDFHLIDVLCMRSLGDSEISSITMSGDLMQRMTTQGIRDWESIGAFLQDEEGFSKEDLIISYRQSPTLLQLAKEIYHRANKIETDFQSFISKDEAEPVPLRYRSDNEKGKAQWIADRILEIHKAYGDSIPSIAIFTEDDQTASQLEAEFKNVDRLADVGIKVKACNNGEVLGNPNTVRIFAVPYIKGLEFEAVFFHDIDNLSADSELLLKYLYVALSRASFYLAITHSKDFVGPISYLSELFVNNATWEV